MRIWNRLFTEGHTERHGGCQQRRAINTRQECHVVRSDLQDLTATSWTLSQEMGLLCTSIRTENEKMFAAAQIVCTATINAGYLGNAT